MKRYFFETCLVVEEANLIRIRLPASQDNRVRLYLGDRFVEANFGPEASVLVTVNSQGGRPAPFPFDTELDTIYDPYVEFFFVGGCTMEKLEVDGKVGLLVGSDGEISMVDPTGAFPHSLGGLRDASLIHFCHDALDPVPGPHSPKRE